MGLELYGRSQALEAVLNVTETTYIGLLSVLPVDSAGEVEISPAGYARILHQDWVTQSIGGDVNQTGRCSVGPIAFPPYGEPVTMRGWGVWDAPTGGNLIASGIFFDTGGGQAGEVTVATGDNIVFNDGDFCIVLGDDCPVMFDSAPTFVCSPIAAITVNGSPWNIGDPPIVTGGATVVIFLAAASDDMPGFIEFVSNASGVGLVTGPASFTITYTTNPGLQSVSVGNGTPTPPCIYNLGPVTIGA